ncbi:hypothetical protein [Polyangium mundeleinium]|uniref:Uncharacterized protein n=1 Tax=Polyangium mundeleinium TaxID=2995306 RepID=A0ABT5EDW7_9BACT|nr:hypothetical protein [Polyangium mundeleinium]MDC0740003.1 hypothetical protein [Polyangium mundeleinium]
MDRTDRRALLALALGLAAIGAPSCAAEDAQPGTRIPNTTTGGGGREGGDPVWQKSFGQTAVDSYQSVHDMAVLRDEGFLFAVVDFDAQLEIPNLAGTPYVTTGKLDLAVVKMSVVEGDAVWGKHIGDPAEQYRTTVAVDKVGNVVLAGGWEGPFAVDGAMAAAFGGIDAYAVKLDANGVAQWVYRVGDAETQFATDVALDPEGNVIVVGVVRGTVDFGDGVPSPPNPGTDIFVVKLDPAGKHLWHQRVGRAASDDPKNPSASVEVMPSGDIVVAGNLNETLTFSGCTLPQYGGSDAFVVRLAPDGSCVFGKTFGPAEDQRAYGLAIGPSNEILVTGEFAGTFDLGGGATLKSRGGTDLFVLALDATGQHLWSRRFGSFGNQVGRSIAVAPSGEIVVGGEYRGVLEFYDEDAVVNVQSGGSPGDVFVLKLDAAGQVLWGKGFGADDGQAATTVGVDSKERVFVGGLFERSLSLSADETLMNSSTYNSDGFVFALSP